VTTTTLIEHPFLAADPRETDRLLAEGLARRVLGDVLVATGAPDSREVRALAAGLLIPPRIRAAGGWVVGFGSASWVYTGLRFLTGEPGPPPVLQVIVPPGQRRPGSPGVRGRQVRLGDRDVAFLHDLLITSPVRTAADIARDLPPQRAMPLLLAMEELCGVRPRRVLAQLGQMRYARGAAQARQLVLRWAEA
jgi:hypothetical protein